VPEVREEEGGHSTKTNKLKPVNKEQSNIKRELILLQSVNLTETYRRVKKNDDKETELLLQKTSVNLSSQKARARKGASSPWGVRGDERKKMLRSCLNHPNQIKRYRVRLRTRYETGGEDRRRKEELDETGAKKISKKKTRLLQKRKRGQRVVYNRCLGGGMKE